MWCLLYIAGWRHDSETWGGNSAAGTFQKRAYQSGSTINAGPVSNTPKPEQRLKQSWDACQ